MQSALKVHLLRRFVLLVLFGYTIVLLVLFGGWSAQAFTVVLKCHQFMNNICSTVVSLRGWSSGLLHVVVFRVRGFDSRRIQSKRARMMRDGVPEADLPMGKAHMERRRRQVFPDTSLSLRRVHTCLLQAITHPCLVTHLSCLLAVSPTCPFWRRVCTALLLVLFGVLFGAWSAQAITYLSFSADGLQRSPTCPFR